MTPIKACRFETFGLIEAPWHKRGRGGVGGRAPLLKCIMGETQETECKHAHAHSGMHARVALTNGEEVQVKRRRET